ncbi:MAG: helix-turn-helix domain-containing protein [Methanomassiliicoccales archaeon]
MPIWEIEITQNDCPNVDTTKQFSNTTIMIMNTNLSGEYMGMLAIVFSESEDELSRALRYLSSHQRVFEFSIISKKGSLAIIHYTMLRTSMFVKSSRNGFRLHPIFIRNGRERWFYLYNSDRNIQPEDFNDDATTVLALKPLTQEDFFVEYPIAFMRINAGRLASSLRDDELKLLHEAYESGYYEWPRKTNLTVLSRKLRMSKSKLSYHFRMIEKKIFTLLLE